MQLEPYAIFRTASFGDNTIECFITDIEWSSESSGSF
jgi:hypothetical protein